MGNCVFCKKLKANDVDGTYFGVAFFTPLNPVVDGHKLFLHEKHTDDASEEPFITGHVFKAASQYAREVGKPFNLITSAGAEATQTIKHLHVHYIPREKNDHLKLPWTGQKKS
jgi:histidine triad (HIT) family protein